MVGKRVFPFIRVLSDTDYGGGNPVPTLQSNLDPKIL